MARNYKSFGTYADTRYISGGRSSLFFGRYRSRRRYFKNWVSDSTGYWVNRVTGCELYFNYRGTWCCYYGHGKFSYEFGSFRYLADKYNS